jgi:hypothetical protein
MDVLINLVRTSCRAAGCHRSENVGHPRERVEWGAEHRDEPIRQVASAVEQSPARLALLSDLHGLRGIDVVDGAQVEPTLNRLDRHSGQSRMRQCLRTRTEATVV